jgi:hypothetical protein
VHLEEAEVQLIAQRGAGVSHCPTSNFNLSSGVAPVGKLLDRGIKVSPSAWSNQYLTLHTRIGRARHGCIRRVFAVYLDSCPACEHCCQGDRHTLSGRSKPARI